MKYLLKSNKALKRFLNLKIKLKRTILCLNLHLILNPIIKGGNHLPKFNVGGERSLKIKVALGPLYK